MATPISNFRNPIRAWLLDTHPTIKQYSADAIDEAVRLVVNLGKAPGVSVTSNGVGNELTPDVLPTDPAQAQNWARIVLYAAERFVVGNANSSSYRTRALSESFGESREAVFSIVMEIYNMEFGGGGE